MSETMDLLTCPVCGEPRNRRASPPDKMGLPDVGVAGEDRRPMETARRNATMVRLLVDYRAEDADHALEDAEIAWTIGFNSFDNTGEDDGWKFAGWCWTHDHFVQGKGKPIGWLPWANPDAAALPDVPVAGGYDPATIEACARVLERRAENADCAAVINPAKRACVDAEMSLLEDLAAEIRALSVQPVAEDEVAK